MLAILVLLSAWRLIGAHRRRGPRPFDYALGAVFFLWCWPAAAWLAVATLELRYSVTPAPPGEADVIVALASNHYSSNTSVPEARPGLGTSLRTGHAAWLFHHWKRLPIVVTGGTGKDGDPRIAELMRRQLVAEGVPDSMISVEDRSQTTYENATGVAQILLPKGVRRIALVTEAFHMPRAAAVFRKQGFDVLPAACCFRTLENSGWRGLLTPDYWAVRVNQETLHEWVGVVWYKLRGRL